MHEYRTVCATQAFTATFPLISSTAAEFLLCFFRSLAQKKGDADRIVPFTLSCESRFFSPGLRVTHNHFICIPYFMVGRIADSTFSLSPGLLGIVHMYGRLHSLPSCSLINGNKLSGFRNRIIKIFLLCALYLTYWHRFVSTFSLTLYIKVITHNNSLSKKVLFNVLTL